MKKISRNKLFKFLRTVSELWRIRRFCSRQYWSSLMPAVQLPATSLISNRAVKISDIPFLEFGIAFVLLPFSWQVQAIDHGNYCSQNQPFEICHQLASNAIFASSLLPGAAVMNLCFSLYDCRTRRTKASKSNLAFAATLIVAITVLSILGTVVKA